jgi:5'-nucleotidase
MRILITNDDGIQAPALPVLANALARAGHDVLVAAPLEGHSGCGASIGKVTAEHRIHLEQVTLAGAEHIPAFSVDSPPAFIVLAAVQGLFGPAPEVIISGPNSGLNLGPLVLHSGTMGAAVTAASNGLPGIALSTEKQPDFGYDTAAEFCARHLADLLGAMGGPSALNINVPDLPLDRIAGVRQTRLAPRSLVAIVLQQDELPVADATPRRRLRVELDHDHDRSRHRQWRAESGEPDDSDAGAIVDGCISVTVVYGELRQAERLGRITTESADGTAAMGLDKGVGPAGSRPNHEETAS